MGDLSFDANISPSVTKLDDLSFQILFLSNLKPARFVYDESMLDAYEALARKIQSISLLTTTGI
jgi:hypothetical protein